MRILIVKLSSIGDVVHALPAAALIRRTLPSAEINWVVERRAAAILKDSPAIDRLIEIDSRRWRKRPASGATIREIREKLLGLGKKSRPIDIAFDFQGLIKSGMVARVSGAKCRIGFETLDLREKASRIFLTQQVDTIDRAHVIEKNLALVCAATGCDRNSSVYEFPIAVSPDDCAFAEKIVARLGRFAIINPGGGWKTKLWPTDRYAMIADWLRETFNLASAVTFGPGEEAMAEAVTRGAKTGAAIAVASSLKQFVALARRAELFVGGDTGPLHIAAACATPIVGIYGPTSPARNGPFDQRDVTVGIDLWCRTNCYRRSCWHWRCMEIPVAEAQRAITTRLENKD
jgi:lipopolysaccharide heptosyltransferase I